jgi:hypothetical protein
MEPTFLVHMEGCGHRTHVRLDIAMNKPMLMAGLNREHHLHP